MRERGCHGRTLGRGWVHPPGRGFNWLAPFCKRQKSCNTCWTFSPTGTFDGGLSTTVKERVEEGAVPRLAIIIIIVRGEGENSSVALFLLWEEGGGRGICLTARVRDVNRNTQIYQYLQRIYYVRNVIH